MKLEQTIKSIINNKTPVFFISPHLDDAIYSAGNLLAHLSKFTNVFVVTAFTEGGVRSTLSGKSFLRQCGYNDAIQFYIDRRAEDKKTIESISAKAIHLGFVDGLWRTKKVGGVRMVLAKLIPEFNHVYPTFILHLDRGRISKSDKGITLKIKDVFRKIIAENSAGDYVVFAPMGIGGHIDHTLVHNICKEIFPNAIFWADFPYSLHTLAPKGGVIYAESENKALKEKMIRGYETQFKAIFDNKPLVLKPEIFYEQ